MTRRTNLTRASLIPWQFPELADPVMSPPLPPAEVIANPAAAADETSAPQPNGTGEDAPPRGDIVAAMMKGHAEGVQRGLVEGREQGYREGFAAGAQAAEQSLALEAQRLAAIVNRLSAPIPAVERTVEDAVLALALEIARCVIGSEISCSHESLVRLIRRAIAKVPIETGALEIVMNPADLDLVRALAPDIETGGTVLLGDATVEAGGCLIVGHSEAKDMRWHSRGREGVSQIDLSLAARWRDVMLMLFGDEDAQ
jgi:flagellar assembly protein FliH